MKLIIVILAGIYFLWCAYDPTQWHLIDGVNLVIHEAGHVVFSPFGEFIGIAGGSLFQVIVPAVFVGYFVWHEKYFSAALTLLWVGESILNVAVYAGDSLALQLPLLGGPDTIHDWNFMLERLGLLSSTPRIAGFLRLCGTLTILTAIAGGIWSAQNAEVAENEAAWQDI